jgi:hypothetical protein
MDATLASLLSFYVFPTGRRLRAMAEVRDAALAQGLDDLAAHCEKTIACDQLTRDLEARWSEGSDASRYAPEARHVDILVDVALGALRDAVDTAARDAAAGDPLGEAAIALEQVAFPRDVAHITTLPFSAELAELRRIVELLSDPAWAGPVNALGLGRRVARLAQLERVYAAAIALPATTVTFAEVNDARGRGQSMMLEAVATILGEHPSDRAPDVAARRALLAPILRQNEAIGGYLKARRPLEDVDPATGALEVPSDAVR